MKITKQRLKEIIKEELENSQNEPDQLDEIDMGRSFAYGDNPGRAGYSVREGKITKDALKGIIAEELTKAEKARKKKLEKELDDLKHK